MYEYMQEDQQKISSCEVLNNVCDILLWKTLNILSCWGMVIKVLWFRADKLISNFKLIGFLLKYLLTAKQVKPQ